MRGTRKTNYDTRSRLRGVFVGMVVQPWRGRRVGIIKEFSIWIIITVKLSLIMDSKYTIPCELAPAEMMPSTRSHFTTLLVISTADARGLPDGGGVSYPVSYPILHFYLIYFFSFSMTVHPEQKPFLKRRIKTPFEAPISIAFWRPPIHPLQRLLSRSISASIHE